MQMADAREVFDMLDGDALRTVARRHAPHLIVAEIEAIRTEALVELEAEGIRVAPSARAVALTMNRDAIRGYAAGERGLATTPYVYAESLGEARAAGEAIGWPVVVKPVMSSSGKGQSSVHAAAAMDAAWSAAVVGMRGDRARVIVEGFVAFDYEITLLTVAYGGGVAFCPPIGHRQEGGDYRGELAARRDVRRRARDGAGDGPPRGRGAGRTGAVRRRVLRARRGGAVLRT